MNREQIALRLRLALIEALPHIIKESAKPIERIDGIKILQVAGLGGGNGHGSGENGTAAGEGSLADQLVNSALRYRAQAPLLDLLMADLGLEAGDLNGLTRGLVKAAGGGESEGGGAANAEMFEITITNLTNAQIFSPLRSEAHAPGTSLFSAGEGASEGIENMAESGDNAQLLVDLEDLEADMVESGGPVLPRATITLTLTSEDGNRLISAVGMLVGTNDAFFGLGAVRPRGKFNTYRVVAYDAGTEDNDENCNHIPGPPCANDSNVNADGSGDTTPPGILLDLDVIHVHRGIQNIGDAAFAGGYFDWRNPVAEITITWVPDDG